MFFSSDNKNRLGKGQSPPIPGAGRKADKRAAPLQALQLIFVKVVAKTN